MNQRAGLTTTPAPGDGAGLRLEINQQEIVGGWATGNGVIAWPESGKINRMHGDSRGQVKGVFGDCQFTCFPDCQLALSPDPAMNLFFPRFRALHPGGAPTMSQKNPSVGWVSLGCPKATVDSERILTQLRMEGYEIVPTYEDA